ncbi:MAG TPA: MBL fold metallo-hydrolase [Hyphomicrobiaceae bacterium]|nr:MBL fold metallo-hydrolase [Hyphomicrobiaceae bacterium]
MSSPARPNVKGFHDTKTGSIQYVVSCPKTKKAVIIDPVLDFDETSARTCTTNADEILQYVRDASLDVVWILDTHPHADHFSAAPYLKSKLAAPTAIGEHVVKVQKLWQKIYNLDGEFPTDGSQWDHLFKEGDTFKIGELEARVMHSPGHTLASITFVIGDAAFVHDTLMMPDSGTSRADFPGGNAIDLYRSIERILALPDDTRILVGHDYGRGGRKPEWESTVYDERETNIHLRGGVSQSEFVRIRETRDAELELPHLMLFALQVNIRAGRLPEAEANDISYLKIPLNQFTSASKICSSHR